MFNAVTVIILDLESH